MLAIRIYLFFFFFNFFDLIIEIEQKSNIVNNSKSIIVILKNFGYDDKKDKKDKITTQTHKSIYRFTICI